MKGRAEASCIVPFKREWRVVFREWKVESGEQQKICIPPSTFEMLFHRFQLLPGYCGLVRLGIFFDQPLKQIPGIRFIPEFQEGEGLFE